MTNNKQQTAVEKAKELIKKMTKQYALIAVDEILSINSVDKDEDLSNYWEEVKQEIITYGGELNNIAFSNKTSTDTANVDLNKPLTKITGL
jgi:enoyl-[acyl-carrier-protein] reductase (NADH)